MDIPNSVSDWAALLDEEKLDWFNGVNINLVDMTQSHSCIFGQVFGSYWSSGSKTIRDNYRSGDNLRYLNDNAYRQEWITEINNRRNKVNIMLTTHITPPVIYEYETGLWDANCGPKDQCDFQKVADQVKRYCDGKQINRIIVIPLNGKIFTIEKNVWSEVH